MLFDIIWWFPYRNSPISAQKYGKQSTIFIYALTLSMVATELIFMKFACNRKRLLMHLYTDFIKRELRSCGILRSVSVNSTPTFRDNKVGYLTLDGGTDRLWRNVGTELPIYAA